MPAGEIHVDDIGTTIRVTVYNEDSDIVDVSDADTLNLIFTKPDKTKVTKTATFYTDGTDGIIKYVMVDGDLDQDGVWKVQGYVALDDNNAFYTDVETFKVYPNL